MSLKTIAKSIKDKFSSLGSKILGGPDQASMLHLNDHSTPAAAPPPAAPPPAAKPGA
jgi:hypothetical protein